MGPHGGFDLPQAFCWTRFGTEAGESIGHILERKEAERCANNGVFYWGIGNSVAPGIAELLQLHNQPEILFSPLKSAPRLADVAPTFVVRWSAGETLSGSRLSLPRAVRVTSRRGEATSRAPHYALVCSSDEPLVIADLGRLNLSALRNLRSGNPVGASQVTAVVSQVKEPRLGGTDYVVALRASLVPPYFLRLRDPALVSGDELANKRRPLRSAA